MDRQPKSILKRPSGGPTSKQFAWDEANLQQNEDEKVPRMKIDEPKTPYRSGIEDSDEEEHHHSANGDTSSSTATSSSSSSQQSISMLEKMSDEALEQVTQQKRTAWDLSSEEPGGVIQEKDRQRTEAEKKAFEAKRKKHYNMGHLLRQQRLHAQEEEEGEDERSERDKSAMDQEEGPP
eukprot:g44221.t1